MTVHRLTIGLLKLFDLFLVMLAFALTTINRVDVEPQCSARKFPVHASKSIKPRILLLAFIVCHTTFSLCGLYRSRRLSGAVTKLSTYCVPPRPSPPSSLRSTMSSISA